MITVRITTTPLPLSAEKSISVPVVKGKTEYSEILAQKGETLLDVIRRADYSDFQAPCGGKGTCGKCRIRVIEGDLPAPEEEERAVLSRDEIDSGIRLACRTKISPKDTGMTPVIHILIPEASGSKVNTGSDTENFNAPRRFSLRSLFFPEPSLEDQRSLFQRLETESGEDVIKKIPLTSGMLKKLVWAAEASKTIDEKGRKTGSPWRLLYETDNLIDIIDSREKVLGMAVDIGTTTIVIKLLDLLTGETRGVWSGMNNQRTCGADVVSRINFSHESPENLARLQALIIKQIDDAARQMLEDKDYPGDWVKHFVIAGNTTMLHLLLGVDPWGIASAPFIPVFLNSLLLAAGETGFTSVPKSSLEILPSISAYVGADITAGLGVTEIDSFDHPVLFIDIGTNGEIALAHRGKTVCCSTAAGPAFEGANISRGTGGIPGAIDKVELVNGELKWTTIDNQPPRGICGSGIIDIAALLINSGAAEYTGRILPPEESGFSWIVEDEEGPALRFNSSTSLDPVNDILFTQKDLREVQLAKAAIAGGILTLIHETGLKLSDIGSVILAGGFGSYINPVSAGRIGLLPGNLSKITRAAGNTSGDGAVKVLLERGVEAKLTHIASSCQYIELSSNPGFQNFYIDEMCFPDIN
ncbi:MAG: DUF4445 domain-containing protein [Spirochaetales bacterium]|nr:DUF4445 domain-containing protein [Spirochaetales bacterium]